MKCRGEAAAVSDDDIDHATGENIRVRSAAKKWLIGVSLAGAAVLAIAVLGSAPRQQLPPESDLEPLPVKEMFARGMYQHLVETRFDVKSMDVRRGQSISVPFTIDHHSHVWWEPVTLKNFQNRPALIFLILFAFVSIVSRKSRFVYLLPSNDHNESKTTHLKRLPPFPGSGSVSR